jgi:hypothetical protein
VEISMTYSADHITGASRLEMMDEIPRPSQQAPTCWGRNSTVLQAGEYFWGARAKDRLLMRLLFVPDQKVQVDLWWITLIGAPQITLCIGLYRHSVEFGELLGNGFNHPKFHQKGFGTLLVNTAIQALQSICTPATRVEGVLSNTEEDGLSAEVRNRLAENRRIFWSRFGVRLVAQEPGEEVYLRGTVGNLATLHSGLVADQFPRFVPLARFSRTRPELA